MKMSSPAGKQNPEDMLRFKELEIEMRRLDIKEKELSNELELRKMEEEPKRQLLVKSSSFTVSGSRSDEFDVNKCIRLIPPFSEKDVKYFILFERVANTLK